MRGKLWMCDKEFGVHICWSCCFSQYYNDEVRFTLTHNHKATLIRRQEEVVKREAQEAIKQDYSNLTATVQPRCGDERDSFQLGVEAVCRPGTLEQW